MIIDSDGREIKLLIGYLKGTGCISPRIYYKGVFCNLEGMFSNILNQQKQKRQLHNYCLSLADES